jgi:peptide/nickel transport system ATP-binding protein
MDPVIAVDSLDVSFGSSRTHTKAVQGVSFRVNEGESFGIVGESGSGKTTVLRALSGLIHGWSGGIVVNGETQTSRRSKSFRKKVQLVFQDPYASLHPRHVVDFILREPLQIHRVDNIDRRVARALEDVGLGQEFRFRFAHQLSGGQRQRIAIARAMILEPRILLLDEPTSALDASVQAEILNLIKRLQRERNLTILFVSHDLAVISHICDRLIVMSNGQVVEELSVQQLRSGDARHPYTRQLLSASQGYDRFTAQKALHRADGHRSLTSQIQDRAHDCIEHDQAPT